MGDAEAERRIPGAARGVRQHVEGHHPTRLHEVERDGVQRALEARVPEQHEAVVGGAGHGCDASLHRLKRAAALWRPRGELHDAIARRALVQAPRRRRPGSAAVGAARRARHDGTVAVMMTVMVMAVTVSALLLDC